MPADPSIRNFSYTLVNVVLYFQENSKMYNQEIGGKKEEKGIFERAPISYKATIKPEVIPKTVYSSEDVLKIFLNREWTE